MEVSLIVVSALFGMAVGSFLNVCIDRLPAGESLLFPASRCAACHRRLAIKDLIPVISYLWLRGHCRYCRAPVPRRLLWVEVGTGILFAYLYWRYGLSVELALVAFYCCLFLVIMVIDLEHGIIPNKIVYPCMAVALVISVFLPPSGVAYPGETATLLFNAFLPKLGIAQAAILTSPQPIPPPREIITISMGWGDVKMAALIGIITGYLIPVALLLAVILGGLVAVILLLFKLKNRKEGIPFAPYLSLGAMITLLFGSNILNWYLGMF
ncbi:Type 4 prepilin-like proteins leader peptide-processing enzyme [subsurface metagenome]